MNAMTKFPAKVRVIETGTGFAPITDVPKAKRKGPAPEHIYGTTDKAMQGALARPPAKITIPGYDGQAAPVIEPVRDIDGEGKREILREHRYDTIGWLLKHKRIDPCQEAAARKLQRDAEMAEILPQASSGTGGSPKLGVLSDAQLTAMTAHADAIAAVRRAFDTLGSAGERLVTLVVIENKTLAKAAGIMREQQQGTLFALKVALDTLAKHYRLA